jgi:transcription antitermination factor NusG
LLTEPLFRGYAFVHLDLGSEEPLIARCSPGVQYLLGRSEPTPVPRSLVDAIRVRTEHENRERGEIGFRSGDRVRVMSKALRDVEAIFDRALSASGRTRVFIRLLGRLVPMDVNIELLAAG